ncbi:hypothetical protein Btru_026509 [Bulinus truncatus]|nr:hypothetical protein Btru_026509 [Bulinus truncatus]
MAENFIKPSHFLSNIVTQEETGVPYLIPPSEFEKPKKSKIKELEKAKELISELQKENERLVQSHTQPFLGAHNQYADELIKRQAGEIIELKNEILICRQDYNQEFAEWGRKVKLLEETHKQEVKNLEKQLESQSDDFELKYSRLSNELQRTTEEANTENLHLQDALDKTKSSLTNKVKELENALRQNENTIIQQENELRNTSKIIADQVNEISRLKRYFGGTDLSHKHDQIRRAEHESQIKRISEENQKLNSELELLLVRFNALNNILSIQERELSKAKNDGLNHNKQHDILLTRWREKVFSLLVQQRSGNIVYKNEMNKSNEAIVNLELKVKSCEANSEVLKLSLMDKSAQLQMETNSREMLQTELDKVNQEAAKYENLCHDNYKSLETLTEFIEKFHKKEDEKLFILEDKSKNLNILCQRLSFASSRLELLKAQLVRKTAIDFSQVKESLFPAVIENTEETTPRVPEDYLQQELDRVTKERDSLAHQIKEDSTRWAQRIAEIKNQYMLEVSLLKKNIEELEHDNRNKSEKCSQLMEYLESLQEDLSLKDKVLEEKQREISKFEKDIEIVLEERRLKDEEVWQKRLAEIDHELNKSKRKHAKMVIYLRQMERNHARDLARNQELLQTTENHLNRQLHHIQVELKKTEKEKNLMMAILKQEGLIHTLKANREEPLKFVEDGNPVFQHSDSKDENYVPNPTKPNTANSLIAERLDSHENHLNSLEPVQDVLKDLKSLTADILLDIEDESDG